MLRVDPRGSFLTMSTQWKRDLDAANKQIVNANDLDNTESTNNVFRSCVVVVISTHSPISKFH